jgi:hypothetical protein
VFGKVRAPVKVTLNGYTYRSTIATMGGPPCVPLRKSNREAAGLEGGETIECGSTSKRQRHARVASIERLKQSGRYRSESDSRRREGKGPTALWRGVPLVGPISARGRISGDGNRTSQAQRVVPSKVDLRAEFEHPARQHTQSLRPD